jgi:Transmembrane secretion effector
MTLLPAGPCGNPRDPLGCFSLNLTVTAGATTAGSAAWGALANVLGVSGAFGGGIIAAALTLLAGVRWRFSSIASYDLSPATMTRGSLRPASVVSEPLTLDATAGR